MKLQYLGGGFSVCTVEDFSLLDPAKPMCFTAATDEEYSLVCPAAQVPANVTAREDGWCALRIEGTLDFSLIGILAEISAVLAAAKIGIFAVSTYRTDYIFIKGTDFSAACEALAAAGHAVKQ